MPNKLSNTERFRTGTTINVNDSTKYLRKPMVEQLPVIRILPQISLSLGGSLNLSFLKKVRCAADYSAIGII